MGYKGIDTDNLGASYDHASDKSSAAGKYYFKWSEHGEEIKKQFGIKTKADFLKNPEAQEAYFKWYSAKKYAPEIKKIQDLNKGGLTDDQLAKLIHFEGPTGARKLLEEQNKELVIPEKLPITNEDRAMWEKMQTAAYQRGIYPKDLDTQIGHELMREFGIDPNRYPELAADIAGKAEAQKAPGALQQVTHGISTGREQDDPEPSQRYAQYEIDVAGQPVQKFGTDVDAFTTAANEEKAREDATWEGFGDPTKNVNYRPPGSQSGFTSGTTMADPRQAAVADPRFPTRDERTGRIIPAQESAVIIEQPVYDDQHRLPTLMAVQDKFNADNAGKEYKSDRPEWWDEMMGNAHQINQANKELTQ